MFRLLIAVVLGVCAAAADSGGDPLRPARECLARADTVAAIHSLLGVYKRCGDPSGYLLLGSVYRERGTIEDRLHSQQVLEDARARFPADNHVRLELGRTYFAQGLFGDAINCFNEVLRADPRNCDAHYLLGLYHFNNWKRVNDFRDNLRESRRELRAAVRCDTSNADAAFKYLMAGYVLGDTSFAESTRMLDRFPRRGEFRMLRGALDFDAGRLPECQREFLAGIALMDDDTRRAYGRVNRVLTGDEQHRFHAADQDSLGRAYWVQRDLDPTTELNEREVEHLYRMFLSDAMFSPARGERPGWRTRVRGWDTDRGEALLKFGTPMSVYYTIGDDPNNGRVEVWSYVVDGVFQQFLFVDEFLNGNPRIPASAGVTMQYLRLSPRQTEFQPRTVPVPGLLDVVAFRDDGPAAAVYLAMLVEADSLQAALGASRARGFNLRTAWFDPMWVRGGQSSEALDERDVPVRLDGARERYQLVRRVRTPYDQLHVACAFEDRRGNARALLVADGDASRFITDGLVLSDILLTSEPGPASAAIVRGGEPLWPRVDHSYGPGEVLAAYVEVYGLSRVAQSTDYDIRFAIYPASEDGTTWARWGRALAAGLGFSGDPSIAQTFRRQGAGHDERESIRIDISTLPPGPYQLVIDVTDHRSGGRASAHTRFQREEASVAERGE